MNPFVFLDSSRGDGISWLARDPRLILTRHNENFVELRRPRGGWEAAPPRRVVVDAAAWLKDHGREPLAGFLGYEFAWDLHDVRAPRAAADTPDVWVGMFDSIEAAEELGFETGGELGAMHCEMSRQDYTAAVQRCIDAIWDGELFQVNYTTRFHASWSGSAGAFYERLRAGSSGSYFGLLDAGEFAIASASPEMFLEIADGLVTTRPIKGTRPRAAESEEDRRLADELARSEKDRAENIMIVDLMRNDLTKFCDPGTVSSPTVCALESFAGVHHLVSTVTGELREGVLPIEALLSAFPAGSITGAPKLRAIEIAAENETSARGAYTGTMFASTGDWLRSNVLIRSATLRRSADAFDVSYGAGGAVVAHSEPRAEWDEAVVKLSPIRRVATEEE